MALAIECSHSVRSAWLTPRCSVRAALLAACYLCCPPLAEARQEAQRPEQEEGISADVMEVALAWRS